MKNSDFGNKIYGFMRRTGRLFFHYERGKKDILF